jgi:hypothetical protein
VELKPFTWTGPANVWELPAKKERLSMELSTGISSDDQGMNANMLMQVPGWAQGMICEVNYNQPRAVVNTAQDCALECRHVDGCWLFSFSEVADTSARHQCRLSNSPDPSTPCITAPKPPTWGVSGLWVLTDRHRDFALELPTAPPAPAPVPHSRLGGLALVPAAAGQSTMLSLMEEFRPMRR